MSLTQAEEQSVLDASVDMLEELGVEWKDDVHITPSIVCMAYMEILESMIVMHNELIEDNEQLNKDLETMHERIEEMAQWNIELEAKV